MNSAVQDGSLSTLQVTEDKVQAAIRAMVEQAQPVEQSRPLISNTDVAEADALNATETKARANTMPVLTPYRVKDVSYWFGVVRSGVSHAICSFPCFTLDHCQCVVSVHSL